MSYSLGTLNAGPVRFLFHSDQPLRVQYGGLAYRDFFTPSPGGGGTYDQASSPFPPLIELPVLIVPEGRPCPEGTPLYVAGDHWAVWADGDTHWLFCVGLMDRQRPRVCCRLSRRLDEATLYVAGDAEETPLCYPVDQILTWALLSRCGGVLVHSAGVVRDGVGRIFAGRSGAGKTTLSALCAAEGWRILNDDRVIIFLRDGQPRMAGTPWHGSGKFAEAGEVPLEEVYLLSQAPSERLESLDVSTARLSMLEVTSIPWFEDDWSRGALDALDALVKAVPVHRFHFTRTPAAVQALMCE